MKNLPTASESFSNISNILERQKQEKKFRLFRKLVNFSNDILFLICPISGNFIDANSTASQMLGYSHEQIMHMKITDVSVKNSNIKIWTEHIGILRKQEKMMIECDYKKNDGTTFPVEVNTRLVNVDGMEYIVAVARDITIRKEEEKNLKDALEDRNKLLANVRDAFFSVDMTNGKTLLLSKANEDIYGYSLNEIYDNPNLWFEVIHPDDKKMILEKMSLFAKGETTYDEHRIKRKDGKMIWVERKVTPTLDEKGKLIRIDGIVSDISKRKKAERLKDEKIYEMNNFLYRTTHDLKSPLASLSGLINLTEKQEKNKNTKELFDLMKLCLNKMNEMLNSLVEIIQNSNRGISADVIDFRILVEEIKNNLKFLPAFEGINFKFEIHQKNEFRTDKKLLATILQNLIDNAAKYRKTENPEIQIKISEDEKGVKITVHDNGIGIPEKLQERIFDMFFRATEFSQGSGLGLYIVNNSVKKLFGKIEVESSAGNGSIFTVYLPDILKYISQHNIK